MHPALVDLHAIEKSLERSSAHPPPLKGEKYSPGINWLELGMLCSFTLVHPTNTPQAPGSFLGAWRYKIGTHGQKGGDKQAWDTP